MVANYRSSLELCMKRVMEKICNANAPKRHKHGRLEREESCFMFQTCFGLLKNLVDFHHYSSTTDFVTPRTTLRLWCGKL